MSTHPSSQRRWFEKRGWQLRLWPEYAEARKPGRVSHSILLDPYLSLEANLWQLRQHILEAYPHEEQCVFERLS